MAAIDFAIDGEGSFCRLGCGFARGFDRLTLARPGSGGLIRDRSKVGNADQKPAYMVQVLQAPPP